MCLNKLNRHSDWATVPLRLVVGIVFLVHGYGKLFGGIEGTAGFFASVGIPAALAAAWLVAIVEFLGGLALLLGIFTRYAAALLAINMLVAIFTVHLKNGFMVSNGGYEFALTLLGASIALLLSGSGKCWSLEKSVFRKEI